MTRFKACAIHFGISVLIGLGILSLMLGLWYPGGYFKLLGGSELLYIMLGVDVCLGPLLTFVVYKVGKKTLKFDLAVIALCQLCALIYGSNVMFQSRPVFNVFEKNKFKVTLASELKDGKQLKLAKKSNWRVLSLKGPLLVAAVPPTDSKENSEIIMAAANMLDWNLFPKLYVEYDEQRKEVLKNAKPLSNLRVVSAENKEVIDVFLKHENRDISSYVYLPIVAGYVVMTAVVDAKNADFIEIINVYPSDK